MKSTIKIDVDANNAPYICVRLNEDASDLRDKMLHRFFNDIGYSSSIVLVHYENHLENGDKIISLTPIKLGQLQELMPKFCLPQVEEMQALKIPKS